MGIPEPQVFLHVTRRRPSKFTLHWAHKECSRDPREWPHQRPCPCDFQEGLEQSPAVFPFHRSAIGIPLGPAFYESPTNIPPLLG
jgi:hypothetical protein